MTRRPAPPGSWRLLVMTAAITAGLVGLGQVITPPRPDPSRQPAPRVERAVDAVRGTEVRSGRPILSLVVERADLYSPTHGILSHVEARGRAWERPGALAFFDGGRLRFAGGVGVRVHGGGSRTLSARQGFRLYFRREYGAPQMPPGIFFGPEAQPLRHLIVHNDVRARWHFVNPLAYDIAGAIGATVPETHPVRFFLNGELSGAFVVTERFDSAYFRAHLGRDDLQADQQNYDELWDWTEKTRPLTMAAVASKVDLDGLLRWFLAVAFSATGDAYQGPSQFLDPRRHARRWFWVNWDMDHSFRDPNQDSYRTLLNGVGEPKRGRNASESRSTLLTHLFAEDEAFRAHFKRLVASVMNHRLTQVFLDGRFEHYRRLAEYLGVEDKAYLQELRTFFDRRVAVFWSITEQWLNTGPSQTLTLRAPPGAAITIDGTSVGHGFVGRYFPDVEAELRAHAGGTDAFLEWRVNGEPVGRNPTLRLRVHAPMDVEAVYRGVTTPGPGIRLPLQRPGQAPVPWSPLKWIAIGHATGRTSFAMLAHEVTVAQFSRYAMTAGQRMPTQPSWFSGADHPVLNVTWDEAQAFCAAHGGRLPTDAEWEVGASGERSTSAQEAPENAGVRRANWSGTDGPDRWIQTAPVGSFAPNGAGLYDVAGNVWEWTSEPHDTTTPTYDVRVVRGGGWNTDPTGRLRRAGLSRHGRHNMYVGFRCLRELPEGDGP
jgi:hypothetical protein